jgi:glyceraldehyde 3-phosphate dehydrogenase
MKKIAGINGFGRFGLHLLKYWLDRKETADFGISFINDDTLSIKDAFNIIISDPYVVFNKYKISILGDNLVFLSANGIKSTIQYTNEQKFEIPWIGKPYIFLECSGKNTVAKDCEAYLKGNTSFVVISATSWDAETFIFGFNHRAHTKEHQIVSYGSCTVNAYVPLANYINKKYGVVESDASFIHNIAPHKLKNFNTLKRKFCTLEKSGPNLLGFIRNNNFTVNYTIIPYGGVSMFDFRFKLKKNITKENFIEDLRHACSEGELKSLYDLEELDRGPEVYNCTTYSAVIIKDNIRVINNNLYLHGYFDNENSVNRYFDLINYISAKN